VRHPPAPPRQSNHSAHFTMLSMSCRRGDRLGRKNGNAIECCHAILQDPLDDNDGSTAVNPHTLRLWGASEWLCGDGSDDIVELKSTALCEPQAFSTASGKLLGPSIVLSLLGCSGSLCAAVFGRPTSAEPAAAQRSIAPSPKCANLPVNVVLVSFVLMFPHLLMRYLQQLVSTIASIY
jgi:hypothetical protein